MLNLIAVFLVCSGIGIAVHIAIDLTHRPQSMKIMNAVWILSALWGSYLALWAYNKFGRSSPMKMEDDGMKGMGMSDMKDMDMSGSGAYGYPYPPTHSMPSCQNAFYMPCKVHNYPATAHFPDKKPAHPHSLSHSLLPL